MEICTPKISIIVPIFNAEKYLERCLSSISEQSYNNFEVFLIDDGSTDSSAEICRGYVENDKRFIYFFQENSGPDIARKTGTDRSNGEYIVYVDADDYIARDMLEKGIVAIRNTEADIVCSQIMRFDEKKEWLGSVYSDDDRLLTDRTQILKAFFETGTLIGTYYAKIIKKSLMQDYSFIKDGLIGEDITAALYMFDKASKIVAIPDISYYYYQNSKSISHAKYSYRHAISLENYIKLRDRYFNCELVNKCRICGYFAGYQMAVATAMGRNGKYEKTPGEMLRRDLKEHWDYIKHDAKTALYMKISIIMYIHIPSLFVHLFRVLYLMTGR